MIASMNAFGSSPDRGAAIGLRQFLDAEQQRAWLESETTLSDSAERTGSLEQRFKYVARFEKFLRGPQAQDVLAILRLHTETCIPSRASREIQLSYSPRSMFQYGSWKMISRNLNSL